MKLSLDTFTKLPSYYALIKDRPAIDPLQIKIVNYKSNNTIPVSIDNVANEETILRQFGDNSKSQLNAAQIRGSYEKYIALLEKT